LRSIKSGFRVTCSTSSDWEGREEEKWDNLKLKIELKIGQRAPSSCHYKNQIIKFEKGKT